MHVARFTTRFKSRTVPADPRLAELMQYCLAFHQQQLAPCLDGISHGNLSFRKEKNTFIITASQVGLGQANTPAHFAEVLDVDIEQMCITANALREPSSESMLHHAIYKKRKDVNAIFHGHSPLILQHAEKINLPHTAQEEPYGSVALLNSVMEILGDSPFIIMKNHGFLSLGSTMPEAMRRVEEVIKRMKDI